MAPACYALLAVSLTGCVSFERMTPEQRATELVWMGVHAVDVLQTWEIARDDCYRETNKLTSQLIGERPSEASVLAWGVGAGWLHAAGTTFLVDQDVDPWLVRAWQWISIGVVADAVHGNHALGIRIGGDNKYGPKNRCSPLAVAAQR